MSPLKLVLASQNVKKAKELNTLLAPLNWQFIPQSELGVSEAEEPHPTFVENALAKARHASQATGLPALADDSGLCVAALKGAPGVLSARFAGAPKSDQRNNALLLEKLQGVSDRSAYFYCAIVMVRHAQDPRPVIAQGIWSGEIRHAEMGEQGFGYDPLFWVPEYQQSAAQLAPDIKNTVSHRGQAIQHLLLQLTETPWMV